MLNIYSQPGVMVVVVVVIVVEIIDIAIANEEVSLIHKFAMFLSKFISNITRVKVWINI